MVLKECNNAVSIIYSVDSKFKHIFGRSYEISFMRIRVPRCCSRNVQLFSSDFAHQNLNQHIILKLGTNFRGVSFEDLV